MEPMKKNAPVMDDHVADPEKYLLRTDNFVQKEEKAKKLSFHERRSLAVTKGRWRNHYKFVGMLPDFRGFEKINQVRVIKDKHFREKRMMILIFQWLSPDVMLLKMSNVCKKFYILSWNEELLKAFCFYNFGLKGYN